MYYLKTKQLAYIILPLMVFACTPETKPVEPEPKEEESLSLEFTEKSLSNKAAEFTLDVTANCDWSFSVDSSWAYVIEPRTSYNGSKTLTIKVLKNESTKERTARFTFTWAKGAERLQIIQAGFDVQLNVSEHNLSFGYRTAEKIINVVSNCGWEAKIDADWLAIRPITGLVGNFEMTVNVETNNTRAQRGSSIVIWNEQYSLSDTVHIVQSGQEKINDKDYVDEYGINYGQGVEIRGLFWSPVNCGYKEKDFPFGKMYQWGRKNGIGYHDANFADSTTTTIKEMWSGSNGEEDPQSFYKYGESSKYSYDWISDGNDSFWNTGTEEKPIKNSQYDPCPEGWRVPTAFEFKSLFEYVDTTWTEVEGVRGYLLAESTTDTAKLFLPAAGRLNTVDGLSYDRNVEGYYWTITADAGSSGYLYFYSNASSVNYKGSRAGGCSVRCIKE